MKNAFYILFVSTLMLACKDTSYPCPAYNSKGQQSAVAQGENGMMLRTIEVKKDKNGLVKKKQVKKLKK